MPLRRMDIQSIVVGGGPIASLMLLSTSEKDGPSGQEPLRLPIRIGTVEASAISMGVDPTPGGRPMTHDLLGATISALGAQVAAARIMSVEGTTFFAQIDLVAADGHHVYVDARPSDAVALAVRAQAPIYADESVLATAALPDFQAVEKDERAHELEEFHAFVENLSPEDFSAAPSKRDEE